VTQIRIWGLEAGAEPPKLNLSFQFTGHRKFADPDLADPDLAGPGLADRIAAAAAETVFAGLLSLVLQGTGPWRLASGHVQTLDEFLGYTFTSRRAGPAIPADGRLLRA
jgi:hypothetical protein